MALSFTTTSLKQAFWPTILDLSNRVQKRFSRKGHTVLSVSLVNGRFRAMSIINEAIHQTWERPGVILKPAALHQAISEAMHYTQFSGTHISILIEDHRCLTLTLQLPIMPLTDLIPILERKAQQAKTCEGPAAWRYHLGLRSRNKQNVQLEIWPKSFIDEICQVCEDLDLDLQQLAPLSALSESQLSTLSIEPGEATILISMLEGKVMFIAAGDDGNPMLTRHLAPAQDWVPLGERVGTEINRTIMFITQQINLTIPHIWFLGEEERLTLEEIQPHVSTPILPCPIKPDWKYWLWVGATLSINLSNNFTPPEVRRAPLRKMFTKTLAAAIVGFVILGVGTTGIIEGYFSKNQDHLQTTTAQAVALQEDQQNWKSQLVNIHTKRQWAQSITGTKTPSLEGPLLSHLGNVIPPQMILHKASIKKIDNAWDVELIGSTTVKLASALLLVDELARELAQGPYHIKVQGGWRDQLLNQTNSQTLTDNSQPHYHWTLIGNFS